ncbi:class I SAM-dependent methyltransferase [Evansella cellulosilytica]|uniref:Methyltransferase type 12 n=1 Tax=Evansella cellulosilytica (strain ATCC 21833 / DSM 2522 / FERM P-1141 / JCM 9156 / N-4) TaxID=649639 RepID=E6TY30_EVAC2|nr:class I SAM-dependent methyltransferase [Evansella cellulosilytica]ADU31243.1 Methyltransferase type 12 [Evansella cellulosilytica DSM 2522]
MNDYTNMLAAYGITEARPGGKKITNQILDDYPIKKNCLVLEIGCGIGDTASAIVKKFGAKVVALDSHPKMIEKAKNRHIESENIIFKNEDFLNATLPKKKAFDVVIAESVLSFTNLDSLLPKMYETLKDVGQLYCLEPIYLTGLKEHELEEYKRFYGFKSLLTMEEWKALFLKHGFTLKRVLKSEEIDQEDLYVYPELIVDDNLESKHSETLKKHQFFSEKYYPFFDSAYFILEKCSTKG